MNQRDLLREMRRLLATGKHEDRKQAEVISNQIGRINKWMRKQGDQQQTKLF